MDVKTAYQTFGYYVIATCEHQEIENFSIISARMSSAMTISNGFTNSSRGGRSSGKNQAAVSRSRGAQARLMSDKNSLMGN
jgi:hypothetical protein